MRAAAVAAALCVSFICLLLPVIISSRSNNIITPYSAITVDQSKLLETNKRKVPFRSNPLHNSRRMQRDFYQGDVHHLHNINQLTEDFAVGIENPRFEEEKMKREKKKTFTLVFQNTILRENYKFRPIMWLLHNFGPTI
ncbi:hypothetical protein OROMI_000479 [Orobanche minor]